MTFELPFNPKSRPLQDDDLKGFFVQMQNLFSHVHLNRSHFAFENTLGRKYRETFLALGGGTSPMEVFRLFRGREPRVDALLRQQGLRQG